MTDSNVNIYEKTAKIQIKKYKRYREEFINGLTSIYIREGFALKNNVLWYIKSSWISKENNI